MASVRSEVSDQPVHPQYDELLLFMLWLSYSLYIKKTQLL